MPRGMQAKSIEQFNFRIYISSLSLNLVSTKCEEKMQQEKRIIGVDGA